MSLDQSFYKIDLHSSHHDSRMVSGRFLNMSLVLFLPLLKQFSHDQWTACGSDERIHLLVADQHEVSKVDCQASSSQAQLATNRFKLVDHLNKTLEAWNRKTCSTVFRRTVMSENRKVFKIFQGSRTQLTGIMTSKRKQMIKNFRWGSHVQRPFNQQLMCYSVSNKDSNYDWKDDQFCFETSRALETRPNEHSRII